MLIENGIRHMKWPLFLFFAAENKYILFSIIYLSLFFLGRDKIFIFFRREK